MYHYLIGASLIGGLLYWWKRSKSPALPAPTAKTGQTANAGISITKLGVVPVKMTATTATPDESEWTPIEVDGERYIVAPRALGPFTIGDAFKLAAEKGWTVPNRKIADAIWLASDLKVEPHPMAHDGTAKMMMGAALIAKHKEAVDQQIGGRPYKLLGGDHKDIVSENGKHGIYGWHIAADQAAAFTKRTGIPTYPSHSVTGARIIQQFPSPHNDDWGDYSQYLYPVKKVTINT